MTSSAAEPVIGRWRYLALLCFQPLLQGPLLDPLQTLGPLRRHSLHRHLVKSSDLTDENKSHAA